MAGSATRLALRRFVLMVVAAVTAAAVTRILGPVSYGQYGVAIATWAILTSAADFGFSLVIGQDRPDALGLPRDDAYGVSGRLISFIPLALILASLAIRAGISTPRGQAMLFLSPSIAAFGLTPARALFIVLYENRGVVRIDIAVAVVQSALLIAVALAGFGAAGVAAVVSTTTVINLVAVWLLAPRSPPERALRSPAEPVALHPSSRAARASVGDDAGLSHT